MYCTIAAGDTALFVGSRMVLICGNWRSELVYQL